MNRKIFISTILCLLHALFLCAEENTVFLNLAAQGFPYDYIEKIPTKAINLRDLTPSEKKEQYNCDILYTTNNELGFDYLRDNMVIYKEEIYISLLIKTARSLCTS